MNKTEDFDAILHEYRLIWNNRLLPLSENNSEETLKNAVRSELLDEYSHPRIRKNRFEKYYLAINRIVNSNLSTDTKMQLIRLHSQIMKELNERS